MEGPERTALVVGGGVIGISCAHFLQKAGFRVTVIDRGEIGKSCSFGNCGYVSPSHVLPLTVPEAIPMAAKSFFKSRSPFKVGLSLDARRWSWMLQFAKRCRKQTAIAAGHHLKAILDFSISEYRKLLASEDIDCQWRESGLLNVFQSKAAFESCRRENDLVIREYGHGAKEILPLELPEIDPALRSNLAGGFLHEGDASLRPDLLNASWRRVLEAKGVQFVEQCDLKSVSRSDVGKVAKLETSIGEMIADVYVFAIGAWSERIGDMTGFKLPVQPGKGYSVTVEKPGFCPTLPMLFPEKKVGISPFHDGFRIGSMMEFVGFNDSIPEYRVRQLKESVQPFFEFDISAIEQGRWTGFRPMTYDTLPVIGPMPNARNGFIATGHSMLGISMAPATGKLVAEMIMGVKPSIEISAFNPTRF